MDSTISVALATKMLQLFPATEATLLAFPVAGEALTSNELDIFPRAGESADDIKRRTTNKAQFARLLNRIPVDSQRWQAGDTMLWSAFQSVLKDATVADTALTSADQARLAAARAYLTDTVTEDDLTTEVYSAAVTAYYTYKDAHDEVERTWLDEKSTAEHSGDAALFAAWEGGRRAELERALAKAKQDWLTLGHQAEVEDAQAVVAALAGRSPHTRRATLLADYDLCVEPDLAANDPVGVLSTFYSPGDAFQPGSTWTTLHIAGGEIGMLLAQAPADLRAGITGPAAGILSVTIEYADVAVVRPWFDPTFLTARTWRLDDGSLVSDGETPRRGRIPAYVSGMVVARKVTVVRTAAAAPAEKPSFKDLGGWFGKVDRLERTIQRTDVTGRTKFAVPASRSLLDAVAGVHAAGPVAAPSLPLRVAGLTTTRLQPGVLTDAVRDRLGGRVRPPGGVPGGIVVGPWNPVGPRPPVVVPPAPPPSPPAPATVTEELALDGVVVLAYRLRRVPRSPDPDPSLGWGGEPAVADGTAGRPTTPVDPHPFPLAARHVFGRKRSALVHDGTASAADRVQVMELQARLKLHGAAGIGIDGAFGPRTEAFVLDFQQRRGLGADGIVGPATWKALWLDPPADG